MTINEDLEGQVRTALGNSEVITLGKGSETPGNNVKEAIMLERIDIIGFPFWVPCSRNTFQEEKALSWVWASDPSNWLSRLSVPESAPAGSG